MPCTAEHPKVSIIIPVYNGADYLKNAIDSALNQTYDNVEIIVVNDGSKDEGKTTEIARSYGNKIRYVEKENGGVSSALNLGIQIMTGDYFSWLSHDDEYRKNKVERQVELLRGKETEKVIALCDTEFIDENSCVLDKAWATPKSGRYDPEQALILMIKKSLSGIALLIPKRAFDECGGFDTALRFTQDADMWRRLFLRGYSLVVDKTIYARSRLHGNQQTNMHRERFKKENEGTAPEFCLKLCENNMYAAAQTFLFTLRRNGITNAACFVENQLERCGYFPADVRVKAGVYTVYGKIRPYIRKAYYKLKFGVESKETKS